MSDSTLPTGAWPVMLTPFNENRSIDWVALDAYTDWLIELGSAGLFAVALSSEMYDLSHDERLELSARVVARAAGRVPVVASSAASGSAANRRRRRDGSRRPAFRLSCSSPRWSRGTTSPSPCGSPTSTRF